eukprot:464808-Hanusia_phi.AAC.1
MSEREGGSRGWQDNDNKEDGTMIGGGGDERRRRKRAGAMGAEGSMGQQDGEGRGGRGESI